LWAGPELTGIQEQMALARLRRNKIELNALSLDPETHFN
jgi:hypothetical protein